MGNGYAGDVVLFEDFAEFLGVGSGVIKFGAAYYYSFSRQQGVVEVFEGNGCAVGCDEQVGVFEERRFYGYEVYFYGPLRL